MTGTGYARSQRGEEEEEKKETQEAVPEQKRVEEKREKKLPTKAPPPVPMVDASRLGGAGKMTASNQQGGGHFAQMGKLLHPGQRQTSVDAGWVVISRA